ncbi:MAG: DegV family protein [Clostridia bacterium]|nr:DegV family protein [Clostridia bacterium]
MSDFILMTDSSCDLPDALAKEMQLEVLPLTVYIGDDSYKNYLDGREIAFKDFYTRLRANSNVKTSAVNQSQFIELLDPLLQQGKDVLYLGFSSGLSGTYSAGASACEELAAKYPERKVFAVDTLCASMGQGLMVWHCWKQKQAGKTIEEVRDFAEENKLHLCHWFTVDDLMFLKRGGRVSAATAIVGSMLSIKPVMHVDDEGHLIKVSTARGRKASIRALVDEMEKTAIDVKSQHVFISHGDCQEDVDYLSGLLRDRLGVQEITSSYVGPVIGAHSGPGTLALFFMGTVR